MNKIAIFLTAAIVAAIAAGAGFWMGRQGSGGLGASEASSAAASKAAPSPAATAVNVEVAHVLRTEMPQTITAVGSLRSDESVTLRPEVAGRISAIDFQEGQQVAKGKPLVRLDPSVAQAELDQARANMTLAEAKYNRAIDLQGKGFISGQAKDEAENNLKVAQASLSLAQAKLAKTTLVAPFSGVIGLRVVSNGDYVKEGTDLVNLESIDPLKVDFRVPEIYLSQVKVGQSLQITLDALPGKTYEGKVIAINPLVDAAGRAVVIREQVRNQDTTLRPGMFARVRLLTHDAQTALVIPEQSIVPQGDDQYVFRVVEGKAARTKITVGQRRDGKVEVVQGLGPDDSVVTAGQLKIRDGSPLQIAGTPRPPKAEQASAAPSKS